MKTPFTEELRKINASTENRNRMRDQVFSKPQLLDELVEFGTNLDNKNHYKGVWILEMIAQDKTELLLPYAERLCVTISKYKNESAIRGISRVAYFLGTSENIKMTEFQQEKLIETCLDWLIGEERVACKVYAMRTLSHFGTRHPWINEELKEIITRDYPSQSPGYKVAAREVLNQIK